MPTTKNILDKIRINGVLEDVLAKSNGENVSVTYNGGDMTLTAALAAIYTGVSAAQTAAQVQSAISTAISNLIGGAPETYDTLKEIADYIASHEEAAAALNAAIGNKADKTAFETLQATVEGLGALAKKNTVAEADLDAALKEKVNAAAEGNHAHANKTVLDGITAEKVTAWDGVAAKTNATGSEAGWMSAADKTRLDGLRGVRYGATAPADMQDGELFVRVVSE